MDQAHLLKVLAELGAKNVRVYEHTGQIQMSCLLAPWSHERGEDNSPSCSISFRHEISLTHCFTASCGFGGTFAQYVDLYNQYRHGEMSSVLDSVRYFERADPGVRLDALAQKYEHKFARNAAIADQLEVWSEEQLAVFKKEQRPSFLSRRRILPDVATNYGVLWHAEDKRVVVPIRRFDGKLVGLIGRHWCERCHRDEPHESEKYINYWNFYKTKFIFNEFLLDKKKPVFVVEGVFDCLRMVTAGYTNTVAIMGSSMSEDQARKLKSLGQPIFLLFDGDAAGRKATLGAIDLLRGKVVRLMECQFPDEKDPCDLDDADLKKVIESAKLVA